MSAAASAPIHLTVSIATLRRHQARQLHARLVELEAFFGRLPCDDEPLSIRAVCMALPSTRPVDVVWMLRAAEPAADARRVAVELAIRAARRVAHLLPTVRQKTYLTAIETSEVWLAEPTPEYAADAADAARACKPAHGLVDAKNWAKWSAAWSAWSAAAAIDRGHVEAFDAWTYAEAAASSAAAAAGRTRAEAAAAAYVARADTWAATLADLADLLS